MRSLSRNQISFYLSSIFFRIMLDASYFFVITNIFAYEGYLYDFSFLNYFVSWSVYLTSFFFVKDQLNKASDYFFVTALLSVIAPLTSLYGLDAGRPVFPVIIVFLALYFIYILTRIRTISFKNMPVIKDGRSFAIIISMLFVGFLIFWYFFSGVNLNLNFSKVYEFRIDNMNLSGGGILNYTNNWTPQIFNIFLFAIALFYRKYFIVVILFFIQVYFFAASTHKSILFLPLLVFGVWFYFKKSSNLTIVPIMFSCVIVATLASYFLLDDLSLSSLFSRRVFYVPANLTFVYFDFFSKNPNIFWSNSVLSGFIAYPYNLSLTHVIGDYLGSEEMGANNGFVASGYAHAGLWGVFIYSFIVGLILRFINDISYQTLPIWLVVAMSIVPLRALLISSDLFTVMLTHGFIVAIILIYLTRSKNASN